MEWKDGIFPQPFQISNIVSNLKSGNPSNYRPISLLPIIATIMANILCIRTETFLEKKGFFFKNQFCFIEKHSTDYAVQFLTTLFNDGLDKHFKVACVFLDILKTFDSVDHEILWCKVDNPGIRGRAVNLLSLYLSDRKLYLNDRDQAIQGYYVMSRVKQGSPFRTQLFSVHINDLYGILSKIFIR